MDYLKLARLTLLISIAVYAVSVGLLYLGLFSEALALLSVAAVWVMIVAATSCVLFQLKGCYSSGSMSANHPLGT